MSKWQIGWLYVSLANLMFYLFGAGYSINLMGAFAAFAGFVVTEDRG